MRFVCGLLLLAACAGAPTKQTTLPADGPQRAADVLAQALARALPQTLQGLTRVEQFAPEVLKGQVLLVVQRPASVQFQALAPTLDLLALMSTDGERFISFQRGGSQCLTGAACPRNLSRLVPIALPPAQLAEALLGRPPLLADAAPTLAWDAERQLYRVGLRSGDQREEVYVRPGSFAFAGAVLYRGDERVASLAYGAPDVRGLPASLHYKGRGQDVSIALREVTVDAPVQPEVWAVRCPDGAQVVELSCEAP